MSRSTRLPPGPALPLRRGLRRQLLLALLAAWMLALAPTLSRALTTRQWLHEASPGLPAWTQICLHDAVVEAAALGLDGGPAAPPAPDMPSLDHCGQCSLAAQLPPPPAVFSADPLRAPDPPGAGRLQLAAVELAPAWRPAAPRAPPPQA